MTHPSNAKIELIIERGVLSLDSQSEVDIAIEVRCGDSTGGQSRDEKSLNLCIVLDRSASMQGAKLESAKSATIDVANSLGPSDQLTVLAFDNEVVRVANPQISRAEAIERVRNLQSGNSTNLSKGWYLGLLELQTYGSSAHLNRLILLSDGQANQGEQKPSVLGSESRRARDELDITSSTIGVGADFQEDILSAISDQSGGNFWFIDEASIEEIVRHEFRGALSVELDRPRVEIDLPADIRIQNELNALPKIAGQYRLRPIKANDIFNFAQRLAIQSASAERFVLKARLYDGGEPVDESTAELSLGSVEAYAQSTEDPRVAVVVSRHLAASSDEEIVDALEGDDTSSVVSMLSAQSDLLRGLESKLAGATLESWDEMTDRDRRLAELRKQEIEEQLNELREELKENETLVAVRRLVDLMKDLGLEARAADMLAMARKMGMQRRMRNSSNRRRGLRGSTDDWAVGRLLEGAESEINRLLAGNLEPEKRRQLDEIGRMVHEQLARRT